MKPDVRICQDKDALARFFGDLLVHGTRSIAGGRRFSLVLSGGSSPRALFAFLAEHYRDSIAWQNLLIFWGDERCVPPDSSESNYRMAKECLLDLVPVSGEHIFRIMGEADPPQEAERYAGIVREQVPLRDNIPQFDFIMLGLGSDGHTASIFPGNVHLFNSRKCFEVARHPDTNQARITVTGTVINQARTVVFVVPGAGKAETVAAVLEKQKGWEQLPASHVIPENGRLFWLLDEKSAAQIRDGPDSRPDSGYSC